MRGFFIVGFVLTCFLKIDIISTIMIFDGVIMKKIISLFICATLIFTLAVTAFAFTGENYAPFSSSSNVDVPANEHIGGDINGDGVVTFVDVVAMLRVTVGDVYNTTRHSHDVNNDGEVSVLDVIYVLMHVLGDDVGLGTIVEAK